MHNEANSIIVINVKVNIKVHYALIPTVLYSIPLCPSIVHVHNLLSFLIIIDNVYENSLLHFLRLKTCSR